MRNDDHQPTAEPKPAAAPEGLLSNLVVGIGAIAGGVVVIVASLPMPTLGSGRPGPGLFPGMIGGFSALFGILLVATSLFKKRQATHSSSGTAPSTPPSEGAVTPAELGGEDEDSSAAAGREMEATQKSRWTHVLVVLGAILFYVLAAETLGFLITMFVALLVILLTLGSRKLFAVIIAAGATLTLYMVFERFLLVQLPDGPLF